MEDKYFVNNFCTIPDFIWKDTTLNNTQKCFLGRVFSLQWNETGWCYAGNDTLGQEVGIKTRNLTKFISNLVNLGYLERKITYEENSQKVKERLLRVVTPTPSTGVGVLVSKRAGAGLQTGRVQVSERGGAGLKASYRVDNRIDKRIDLDISENTQIENLFDDLPIGRELEKKVKKKGRPKVDLHELTEEEENWFNNLDEKTIKDITTFYEIDEYQLMNFAKQMVSKLKAKGYMYKDFKQALPNWVGREFKPRKKVITLQENPEEFVRLYQERLKNQLREELPNVEIC
jgi:hypothetical protein